MWMGESSLAELLYWQKGDFPAMRMHWSVLQVLAAGMIQVGKLDSVVVQRSWSVDIHLGYTCDGWTLRPSFPSLIPHMCGIRKPLLLATWENSLSRGPLVMGNPSQDTNSCLLLVHYLNPLWCTFTEKKVNTFVSHRWWNESFLFHSKYGKKWQVLQVNRMGLYNWNRDVMGMTDLCSMSRICFVTEMVSLKEKKISFTTPVKLHKSLDVVFLQIMVNWTISRIRKLQ